MLAPESLPVRAAKSAFVLVSEKGSDIGPFVGQAGPAVPYEIVHGNRSMAVEIRAVLP